MDGPTEGGRICWWACGALRRIDRGPATQAGAKRQAAGSGLSQADKRDPGTQPRGQHTVILGSNGDNTLVALAVKEQDLSLYRRIERRLDERLAAIEGLEQQLAGLRERRASLNARPPAVELKSQHHCTLLLVAEPAQITRSSWAQALTKSGVRWGGFSFRFRFRFSA
jgi:hypothetical protein